MTETYREVFAKNQDLVRGKEKGERGGKREVVALKMWKIPYKDSNLFKTSVCASKSPEGWSILFLLLQKKKQYR